MEEGGKICYNTRMGYPIPPPPVFGDNCAVCDGTLWQPGETPRFIHVELKGLVKCGGAPLDPPNAIWVPEQDAVNPGLWEYEDNKFFVRVAIDVGATQVSCSGRGVAAGWEFFLGILGACKSDFPNIYVACFGNRAAFGGTAHIDWE